MNGIWRGSWGGKLGKTRKNLNTFNFPKSFLNRLGQKLVTMKVTIYLTKQRTLNVG